MKTKIQNGWIYLDREVSSPHVKRFRNAFRASMNPEVVTALCDTSDEFAKSIGDYGAWCRKWCDVLRRADKLKKLDPTKINLGYNFKVRLMHHQLVCLAYSLSLPSCGLFLEPGCGKTCIALNNIEYRLSRGTVKKPLVIAPTAVMTAGWLEDAYKLSNLKPVVLHNTLGIRQTKCHTCGTWYTKVYKKHTCGEVNTTIEYNEMYRKNKSLESRLGLPGDLFITSPTTMANYVDLLLQQNFDMVVFDESTMMKSPDSAVTKAAHKLGNAAKFRIIMTGTPIGNDLEGLWSQMYFLDQSLGPTFGDFIGRHFRTHPQHFYLRWPVSGAREAILDRIKDRVIVYTKEDCLDLPDIVVCKREVAMTPKQKKLFSQMKRDDYVIIDNTEILADNPLSKGHKLLQLTGGFIIDDEKKTHIIEENPPKLKQLLELVKQLAPSHKIIVWAQYKHDRDNIMRALKDFHPVELNSSNIDKTSAIFKESKECRVAVSHPKSCQFGITLTESDITIYYGLGYSSIEYAQSRDRNYRKGQDKKVTVYHIIGSEIDSAIYESVIENRDFTSKMMEDLCR